MVFIVAAETAFTAGYNGIGEIKIQLFDLGFFVGLFFVHRLSPPSFMLWMNMNASRLPRRFKKRGRSMVLP
jgi:hypothetical protein